MKWLLGLIIFLFVSWVCQCSAYSITFKWELVGQDTSNYTTTVVGLNTITNQWETICSVASGGLTCTGELDEQIYPKNTKVYQFKAKANNGSEDSEYSNTLFSFIRDKKMNAVKKMFRGNKHLFY